MYNAEGEIALLTAIQGFSVACDTMNGSIQVSPFSGKLFLSIGQLSKTNLLSKEPIGV